MCYSHINLYKYIGMFIQCIFPMLILKGTMSQTFLKGQPISKGKRPQFMPGIQVITFDMHSVHSGQPSDVRCHVNRAGS